MPLPGEVTDLHAIETAAVKIPSGDTLIEAYVAAPKTSRPRPGVIVIHEAFGPVEHIHDLARRFANVGFTAIAPNLYSRVGTPDPNDRPDVLEKMFSLPDWQIVKDLNAVSDYVKGRSDSSGKLGCIGFCSGGRQTLLFACNSEALDAAVDCWGGFVTRASWDETTTENRPVNVIDMVGRLKCPLLGVFGGEDQNPSPDEARELEARIRAAGLTESEILIFEDAGHAFLADYRPEHYREAPAFRLWPRIVGFFETHLK